MRLLRAKARLRALTPIFILSLILGTSDSLAKGKNVPTEAGSQDALQGTAAIPADPREIEQIFIPAGKVILGSDKEEKAYAYTMGGEGAKKWRWFDGEVKRQVFVDDFFIDKYPVTQAQYYEFVQDTGHRAPFISAEDYLKQGFLVHPYEEVRPYLWKRSKAGYEGSRAHRWLRPPADRLNDPVVLVSAEDATEYCRWRGSFYPKKIFALPSEDQWEKAARGSDARYFPWGNSWDNSLANIGGTGPQGTTPVYKYDSGKSPYGVFEMAGNIFEWTGTPSRKTPEHNILKSCSWDDMPGICRGAARHSRHKKSRHILIGFRCVSTIK
ncbi:MAG: formylglycine-generating enzyme family protein [Thermodesulfobacteriota bacterium]